MSLTARLYIKGHSQDSKGIKVLSCNFSFSQDVDNNGLARSSVRAGLIHISIPGINDAEIVQWMVLRDMRKNGRVSFWGVNESGVPQESKKLEFEDAILVDYSESFNDESDMIINLSISARKINLSNTDWETKWDPGEGDE